MTRLTTIEGSAVPLPIDNLDTDQIMPKQFLRIIDKAGLADGLLYDLRFDEHGAPRADCVLNQPRYANARGLHFGCDGRWTREHCRDNRRVLNDVGDGLAQCLGYLV